MGNHLLFSSYMICNMEFFFTATNFNFFSFEATRKIRNMENDVNDLIKSGRASAEKFGNVAHWHIPILAMTADVFQATHDECVRCGMDDFVSKPFEEEQLYSAVAYFFEPDSEQADPNL